MSRGKVLCVAITAVSIVSGAARATEVVTYTYDAKGRLVKVVKAGTVNNGVTVDYSHDKIDNRTNVKVTGAP